MLRFVLSLRLVTLIAALAAARGAILMFVEGCAKLGQAIGFVLLPSGTGRLSIISSVM
jgi:hypothetical protein